MAKQKCFQEVEDFEEKVKNHDLNVIFLHDDSTTPKRPVGNKYNYQSYSDIIKETNINRNLGIGFPQKVTKDLFLCVIDIDGDSQYCVDVDQKEELKVATRRFLFEVIKNKMDEYGLKPMYVKTANDGYHIYLYITQSTHKQHGFQKFMYPTKEILSNNILGKDFLKELPILNKAANKKMGTKSIEIFTQGAYVVAPGSVINGKKYTLLGGGAQRFEDISIYGEKTIQDFLEDIFLESFFQLTQEDISPTSSNYTVKSEYHDLEPHNIRNIGDLIIKAWPLIDGQKQEATLALGGFLYKMQVSEESIRAIGDYVIDNKNNPNFFKHDDETERTSGFMTSLLHDTKAKEDDKKTNGLTFLKSIFEGKISSNELSKTLWLNSRPMSHSFLPNNSIAKDFVEIKIDFDRHNITAYNLKQGAWNEDEEKFDKPVVKTNQIIFHSLDDFKYLDDISSPYESNVIYKKTSFVTTNELGMSQKYIFENTEDMIHNYNSIPGAHVPSSENILRHIINEYERIGLIEEIEDSSNPGIYFSRDGETLRRFILTEKGIEELKPECPDKQDLINALEMLTKINEVYPWEENKFGAFIKLGLLLPYGYVFKSHFNDFFRGIILYGEAGTLKSTAADLITYMSMPEKCIKLHKKWYITSGSELRTEFRIGRAVDRHSYPVVVNECEGTFSDVDNRELIKNAITDIVIREPGGDNPRTYYSRGIPILTANELPEEVETSSIARRFLVLNFLAKERGDIPEVIEKMQFLNEDGKRNSRFKELSVIGDFVYYTLSNNLEFFHSSPQEISDKVVNEMIKFTGLSLDWLLDPAFTSFEDSERQDEDQGELEMAMNIIRKPFLDKKNRLYGRNIPDTQILEDMFGNEYPYIFRVSTKYDDGILITPLIKSYIKKEYRGYSKSVSVARLTELMNSQLDFEHPIEYTRKTCVIGGRKRGIYMSWVDFLALVGANNTHSFGSINTDILDSSE